MTRAEYQAQKAMKARMRQTEQKHTQAAKGSMDLPFLILTLLLTVIGLIMLFSASFPRAYYDTGDGTYYFKRQALFAVIGLAGMFVVGKINYQRWRGASRMLVGLALFLLILVIIPHNPLAKPLLYLAVILLILVIVPGNPLAITRNNATRWLGIKGVFQFQPSEIAKLAVIVYFSDTISKKKEKMLTWRQGIVPYVALLGIISVLMMLEPHLSGTVLILCTGAVLMIVGGIQGWLVAAGIGGVGAIGLLFVKLAESGVIKYGSARIAMWHDPWLDYSGDGYQLAQSLITIGSGGLLGVGLGRSRQKFLYLPEQYNDFIFSVVCEELGLIGACVIMLIFALLILRGFWIALHARDRFGALLVVGIMTHLALQTFLNIAVVSGFVPTTGISLPFFSYGGTALCLQLVEMGMVLSVSRQIPAPKAG